MNELGLKEDMLSQFDNLFTKSALDSLRSSGVPTDDIEAVIRAHMRPVLISHAERTRDLALNTRLHDGGWRDEVADDATARTTTFNESLAPIDAALDSQEQAKAQAIDAAVAASLPEPSPGELEMLGRTAAETGLPVRMAHYASATPRERRVYELLHERGRLAVRRPDGTLAWEPWLDDEQLSAFREARRRAANPEAYRELERIRRVRATYHGLAAEVRRLLRESTASRSRAAR